LRLLDVNILIALAWPSHIHHALVYNWFQKIKGKGWCTSTVTELGFIRISSNPKIIEDAVTPLDAQLFLVELKKSGKHHFAGNSLNQVISEKIPSHLMVGHRQVSDFHLMSIAIEEACQLITLDKSLYQTFQADGTFITHIELLKS